METYQQKPKDKAIEQLECYIIENNLKPHDRLPSERELCDIYGFNRMTLRSAIQKLIGEGIIYNKVGSGTFVAEKKLSRELSSLYSMSEYAKANNLILTSKVLSFQEIESDKKISQRLQIMLGSKIYELIRLRMVNKTPLTIETVYLPAQRFPGLLNFNFVDNSLYQILEQEYGVYVNGGEEIIGVTYLNEMEAKLLQQSENSAVFFIQSVTHDVIGLPVEYLKSITRADNFYYSNILSIQEDS